MGARVGVLLSGCGAFDGSDLHEAVLTLLALERRSARAVCIAPDRPQLDVVDHLSGQTREQESRQVWEEAGRIARGKLETPSASLGGRPRWRWGSTRSNRRMVAPPSRKPYWRPTTVTPSSVGGVRLPRVGTRTACTGRSAHSA